MERNDSILEGKPGVSSVESTDSRSLSVGIVGISESWRVSQLLQLSGVANDPSQPYYPQFTIIARSHVENSSQVRSEDAGFISVRFVDGVAYIVSIVVVPKHRRAGVAEKLFATAEDMAVIWDCKRMAFKLRKELKELTGAVVSRGYKMVMETDGIGLFVKEL